MTQPNFVSEERWVGRRLLTLFVVLMLANIAASVLLNAQSGEPNLIEQCSGLNLEAN